MLEDRPILRERVLAAAAMSTVLIGGAMAMNTIVTGGWQWGTATAATHQLYYDDVDQQWSEPAPSVAISQPVAMADASYANVSEAGPMTPEQATANAGSLDGASAAVSLTSYQPTSQAPVQDPQPSTPIDDQASKARFDQIEADIRQADPQQQYADTTQH